MREIVFDTETTGLDPTAGHRIVEIGCIEILNSIPTGQTFHFYLDPERDMPEEAFRVHGISAEFLIGKPKFAEIAEKFLMFVGDAMLVAHNAEFDLRFVNAELAALGHTPLGQERIIDTLALARRRHPGAPASLDALCRRFAIDLSARDKHGADIDCGLLAKVYIELLGGRQPGLDFAAPGAAGIAIVLPQDRPRREPRPHAASPEELAAHLAMLAAIKAPLWLAA